jgi:hypothetical protein
VRADALSASRIPPPELLSLRNVVAKASDAASSVDQRVLGITHNPLRMTGHPMKIVFRGCLVADA